MVNKSKIKFLENFDFSNMNVYVLGGSGLIGQKVSELFSNLNANLVILDIKNFKSSNNLKKFSFAKFDINNIDKYDFKSLFSKYGSPNIFVNTSYPRNNNWDRSSFKKLSLKNLKKNVDLHLNSYVWTAKIFADEMQKKDIHGSIVLTSSIYGFKAQDMTIYDGTNMTENSIYPIIKSGIINYTRQLASIYGKHKIRVNTISPGGLYGHDVGTNAKTQNKKFLKNYSYKAPLSRLGYADEVANSIIFLSSNNSSYTTGANLIIDGGITVI